MKGPKIAIDVSPLSTGDSVRGVGHFTKQLVTALKHQLATNPDYKNWQIDFLTKAPLKKYQLIHFPYFHPFRLDLPIPKNTPFVLSIYDLIPRQFKKHFPVGLKGELKWQLQRYRAKQAKYIITCSHYSKHIIKDLLHYPADHIYVTYGAADSSYRPRINKLKLEKIRKKYSLPKKFVLFVGDINWNKNIPSLVRACLKLNYPLVIAGSAAAQKDIVDHPWNQDLLWLQKQNSPLIIKTGFVPDLDLPYLYNLATIYCQPSFAEGFGLPVIQAMASACPVVYSIKTSLAEIADYNGLFFDPYKRGDLQKALKQLWTSQKLQTKFKKLGLAHAKTFGWNLAAIQTLAVYRLSFLDENN